MEFIKPATCLFLSAVLLTACSEAPEPSPPQSASPDAAAIAANNRAVGLMGKFEYEQAERAFADIVSERPGWIPARVNLAIATLNRQYSGDEAKALEITRSVLGDDPDNLRARYVTGLIQLYLGDPELAIEQFQAVADADPEDAYAAYYVAQCSAQMGDYESALPRFRLAMQRDPYLRSAYYGAFQALQRLGRPEEAADVVADYQRLENNPRSHLAEFKYTKMGPKGTALAVGLADEAGPLSVPDGSLFAESPTPVARVTPTVTKADDGASGLSVVDMQNDGQPDLLVTGLAPSGETQETPSLVLRGQEDGGFEAIPGHPLSSVSGVNAALWGDYDNDGRVDVYLCRHGPNQLWRQTAPDTWEDVTVSTRTAGGDVDTVDGAFFDADHDGDLDLFLVNSDGPNELLNNNLDGTFRPLAAEYGLAGAGDASRSVVPVDLDGDRDADIVVMNRQPPHEVYLNDRLWSYRPAGGFDDFIAAPSLTTVAADLDADGQVELYTAGAEGELLRWQTNGEGRAVASRLASPSLLQGARRAQLAAADIDGDGTQELVLATPLGWSVHSVSGSETRVIFEVPATEGDALAFGLPFTGNFDNGPGLLTLSAAAGISLWTPGPGRHPFVALSLSGRRDDAQSMRSNASGVGARVSVRTGSRWSVLTGFRNHSGPGQSLQPLAIGLGGANQADFISVDWSDGVFQSEIDVAAGMRHDITETQRQLSSCPVLFAWNGESHVFVSDLLGVGGIGYAVGPGEYTTPRPWENFLFPDGLLQPKGDRYEIKIGEPMEENAYLDAARLAVYDLPPGWRMVMDERMGISEPLPTGEPSFYRRELLPRAATSNRGGDVLDALLEADGQAAPVGELDSRFIGRLEGEHELTLDFAEALDQGTGQPMLVIDGWVEYPYSQTNFAAWQAGAAYEAPTLEAFDGERWVTVAPQFGYPAGMPRRMSLPLDGLPDDTTRLRLRSNMQIYWDRIAVAWAEDLPEHVKTILPLAAARLSQPGFAQRSTLSQHRPYYEYAALSPFWDTRYMRGFYTRFGPVEELVAKRDDAVAIIGPGEEVHLEFVSGSPAPEGWSRFFVLEANGWAKDMDLFTRDGDTVGPLPSSGLPAAERDALHARYNTRFRSGR